MNTKAFLLSSVGVAAISFNASAADFPIKAPPRPVPVETFSWTGFYIGSFVGAAGSNSRTTTAADPNFDHEGIHFDGPDGGPDANTRGLTLQALSGVTIGYNWQVANNIVLGVEADAAWLSKPQEHSRSFSNTYCFSGGCGQGFETGTLRNSVGARWISTARARLGMTYDRAMVFVTGGLAVGGVKSTTSASYSFTESTPYYAANGTANWSGSSSKTKWGYAVGSGFEFAFTKNVILKADWLYYNLGKVSTTGTGSGNYNCRCGRSGTTCSSVPAQSYKATHTVDGVMARIGMNYKF